MVSPASMFFMSKKGVWACGGSTGSYLDQVLVTFRVGLVACYQQISSNFNEKGNLLIEEMVMEEDVKKFKTSVAAGNET